MWPRWIPALCRGRGRAKDCSQALVEVDSAQGVDGDEADIADSETMNPGDAATAGELRLNA